MERHIPWRASHAQNLQDNREGDVETYGRKLILARCNEQEEKSIRKGIEQIICTSSSAQVSEAQHEPHWRRMIRRGWERGTILTGHNHGSGHELNLQHTSEGKLNVEKDGDGERAYKVATVNRPDKSQSFNAIQLERRVKNYRMIRRGWERRISLTVAGRVQQEKVGVSG